MQAFILFVMALVIGGIGLLVNHVGIEVWGGILMLVAIFVLLGKRLPPEKK